MGKTNIDMWYGDKPEQVTGLDIYFNDLGGFYSGNLRIFGKYAESKGYEVNFGKYEYNQNVPYIKINGCTIFIAEPLPKFGTQGLSANPNFSFKKLDNLIYYAKAYGNDNILDFSKFILEEIKSINNTFYPYFPEEIKEFEKDEYMNDCFMEWNPEGEASEFYTENVKNILT